MNSLEEIKTAVTSCKLCSIGCQEVAGCNSNVFSNMTNSKIMVIGQNPGETEVKLGVPFVGMSGKFFDSCIKEVLGIERSALYITNTVKCYTQGNRAPTNEETANCRAFLDKEIEVIKPKIIVTLGNPALKQITGYVGITKWHGQIILSLRYKTPVLPLYHPSPLNTNKPAIREEFKQDLAKLREYL